MLTKYLGKDSQGRSRPCEPLDTLGSNLHYATPLASAKKYKRFLKQHQVAIVGHFKREADREHQVFLEAVWSLWTAGRPVAVAVAWPTASEHPAPSISIHSREAVEEKAPEAWSVQALRDLLAPRDEL